MKQVLLCGFLLLTALAGAQQENQVLEQKALVEAEMKAHTGKLSPIPSGFANDYNLIYQRCEWNADPAVDSISGAITSYFKPSVNGFSTLHFDMADSLRSDSIRFHQSLISFSHGSPNTNVLSIQLPITLMAGSTDSVTVFYHGRPNTSGFGSFYQGNHQGAPVLWTLSEPYGAKDWWPCKQNLTDKIDSLDIFVSTPPGNKAASNGVLVSEIASGSKIIHHWKTRYPTAAYLVAIAVTNYVSYSHFLKLPAGDSLEVLNYVYPEDLAVAQSSTPQILKTIALYDSLTILYPFHKEKYGHAEFGWGGGMEHQTMSFVGGFSNTLISHECAHQWFGDRVTTGSWADIWLNEGFATYMEALTEERYFPDKWLSWKKNTIVDATKSPHGSVKVDDTTSVSRIFSGSLSYSKGAYLLHMLRWKMGNTLFFQALRDYLNDPKLAYQYAHTPDLMHHLEATSGQSLGTFFNQWFIGKGYPSYQVYWSQSNGDLTVTVNQTQSDSSVSFFEMPIPIQFTGGGHDTTLVFYHTYSGQTFTAKLNFMADFVHFDPELWILSAHNQVISLNPPVSLSSSVLLFPNPAWGELDIQNSNPSNPIQKVEVFGIPGNFISRTYMSGTESLQRIDVSSLAAGMYFVKVYTDKGNLVRKVEVR